jgi:hypothetical protein
MASYLTVEQFKLMSLMPSRYADELEIEQPGWVLQQLDSKSRWIDARLRKRYAAPFEAPVPEIVLDWLQRIVTARCYLKKGIDPTDKESASIFDDAETAETEVQQAADSVAGLFDLPLRADLPASTGIVKGGPIVYSEASPYTWTTLQRELADNE